MRVPTFTRSFVSRMQPEDTNVPMVDGWFVPWMR
jgi:hypothetical protein